MKTHYFLFRHSVLFVKQGPYLLSERTELVEHYTFSCHLLHDSAVFGHHHVGFTT